MTKECLELIHAKDSLCKQFLKAKNIEDLKKFNACRNRANSIMRRAKRNYVNNLFSVKNTHILLNRLLVNQQAQEGCS